MAKVCKCADEVGLVAELLKQIAQETLQILLTLLAGSRRRQARVHHHGKKICSRCCRDLPRKELAKAVFDFCPIAISRLFSKTFAYMILHRVESLLDIHPARRTARLSIRLPDC